MASRDRALALQRTVRAARRRPRGPQDTSAPGAGSGPRLPRDEYRAITEALASSAWLTEVIPEPHGEAKFRGFLQRLLAQMDKMRLWRPPRTAR
ncbi:MAG: hypothetical protein LC808_23835 [Actinobacteria bacterium]|nr:hypothetical protein [Actinomycetota bacterium]